MRERNIPPPSWGAACPPSPSWGAAHPPLPSWGAACPPLPSWGAASLSSPSSSGLRCRWQGHCLAGYRARLMASILTTATRGMSLKLIFLNKGELPCACQSPEHLVSAGPQDILALHQSCSAEKRPSKTLSVWRICLIGCGPGRFPVDLVPAPAKPNSLFEEEGHTKSGKKVPALGHLAVCCVGIKMSSYCVRGMWAWFGGFPPPK